ncbi:ligase-associated DNA damage response DEXH box helicase [Haloferula sp. A504]|uniref:ligase-associated DNA damage response DEXH box helicase n=1 Tax=Haloferula sp. A504 TaxID=3373601 RepID=UPI0031C85588|nr:ligase-associated DNA damage response DEXH box helicase [Verrucomicrobiaceae bacterium E54]
MLRPPLLEWLHREKGEPLPFQKQLWKAHAEGRSGLLHAPTGFGKTLAAWLGPVAAALDRHPADKPAPCSVLWITPLRALAADTLMSLREPIKTLAPAWEVEARTGDTSSYRRAKLRERLPFGLVTTPESLSLMLTYPDFREKLKHLQTVIVDEWHELLGTKRGVQTELALARLRRWCPEIQIWGLSATLGNLDEARDALIGPEHPHAITVSAKATKPLEIETLIPDEIDRFPWAGHLGTRMVGAVARRVEAAASTLLFTNTRSQTEIWFQELKEALPKLADSIAMHHGSLAKKERASVEAGLKDGSLRCVVCTSSLDLGVDFSPVDQVIQVGSPKGIARLAQRAGRSGHQPGQTSRIVGVPTHAFELLEFAAARDAWKARHIESRRPLHKPLDLLVQHTLTCVLGQPDRPADLLGEFRTTLAYRDLDDEEWRWVVGFITEGGDALKAYPQYRKATLRNGVLHFEDKRAAQLHRLNIGTITSGSAIALKFASGKTLGTVEESFITRLKPGQAFIFGGRQLELVRFHKLTATVRASTRRHRGQVPVWNGGKMPLSTELASAIATRLHGRPAPAPEHRAVRPILAIQRKWSAIPGTRELVIEFTRTREGEHLFLYPFAGRLVHEGLAALAAYRISSRIGESIDLTQNDYGFSLIARRGLSLDEALMRDALTTTNLVEDLLASMNTAEMARRQFREVARVAGLLVPDFPGKRRPTRDLQVSSSLLFEVFSKYDPANLLLDQARREILQRQLEWTRLKATLDELADRPFRIIETERLTPMAFPLWADRLSAHLPAGDAASRLEAMLEQLSEDAMAV